MKSINVRNISWAKFLTLLAVFTFFGSFLWVVYTSVQAQFELNKVRVRAIQIQSQGIKVQPKEVADFISFAREHLARANQHTSGPLWWIAERVPYLGRTPNVIHTLTNNLDSVFSQTHEFESKLRTLPAKSNQVVDTKHLTELLPSATKIAGPLESGAESFKALNYSGVPNFLASKVQSVGAGFENLSPVFADGKTFSEIGPVLLGFEKPKQWMLVFLNGAEARAPGGLPGGWGILRASAGRVSLTELHDDVIINLQSLANWREYVTSDQAQLYGDDLSRFADMNLSPDFPTNARLMAALLKQVTGKSVDGVLTINQNALADMVAVTGPIAQNHRILTSENIADYVTKDVYSDFKNPKEKNIAVLSLIQKTFDKLKGGAGGPFGLVRAFAPPMHTGSMMLWASDKSIEKKISSTHVGGSFDNLSNPTSAIVLVNGAGNKLDSYISESVQYSQGICSIDAPYRDAYLRVKLENNAPESGLPNYVTPRNDLPVGANYKAGSTRMLVYVHVPLGSEFESATINEKKVIPIAEGFDTGRQVWRFDIELDPQSDATLFVSFQEVAEGNEPTPSLWTQSMPIDTSAVVEKGQRCVR